MNTAWASREAGRVRRIFGGLSADTEYRIYRRLAATDTAFASETSEVLVLRTLEAGKTDPVNPNPGNPDSVNPNPSTPRQSAGNDHFRPRQKY